MSHVLLASLVPWLEMVPGGFAPYQDHNIQICTTLFLVIDQVRSLLYHSVSWCKFNISTVIKSTRLQLIVIATLEM